MPDAIRLLRQFWSQIFLGISALIFLTATVLPASNKITVGFAAYYTASRLALEHRSGAIFYDDVLFRAEVERLTEGQASDIYWANPPTTAILFLPLALLSPASARRIWIWLSFLFLALAIESLGRLFFESHLQSPIFCVAASIFLLSEPLATNFEQGQVYVFLLFLYVLAIRAMRSNLDWPAGFCLGLVLAFKTSGLPILVLLAMQGRWRVIAWSMLFFAAVAVLSLPMVGISAWQVYLFHALPAFLSDPAIAVTAYQTIPGLIRHLFTYDSSWNPFPLMDAPNFATLLILLITFLFLLASGVASKECSLAWTFCVGLILSLILVPAAEQHHYVLSFPAFLLASSLLRLPRIPLAIAAALVVLPFSCTSISLSQGWWAWFAYPRLYGAVFLLAVLLLHNRRAESLGASSRT